MDKQHLTLTQGSLLIALFITGSSFILGINHRAEQDSWASVLIAYLLMLLLSALYVRILKLYPDTLCFFDVIEAIAGKFFGKIIIAFFAFYGLHLGALVTRDFSEFIKVVSMPETPQLPLILIILITSMYLAASGIKTLGKWSVVAFPLLLGGLALTIFFSANIFNKSFLFPILNTPYKVILLGAWEILAFPFAETIVFLNLICSVKKETNIYKMYALGISLGALLLLIVMIRNILVLGPELIKISYFPSYSAAKAIQAGKILQRIEGTITINFVLGGITKITICLIFAARALAKLLNVNSYRRLIVPSTLIILALTINAYTNTVEMFNLINIYALYALPFQVIIPFLLWITAEIKNIMNRLRLDKLS